MRSELNASVTRPQPCPFRSGHGGPARRTALRGLAAAAAASLLAACGSSGGSAGAAHPAAASHRPVISARMLPGIGSVLVDRTGKTVYSPEQEAHGTIKCTGSCLSFWFPVTVAAGSVPRAPRGVHGVLATIHRPGGLTQLTYNGRPLYTFRLDQAPGQAHGNDFTDHFGGTSFTWHAVTTSGAPARTSQPQNPGGYPTQSGSPGY